MTWEDFIESKYNTSGFYVSNGVVCGPHHNGGPAENMRNVLPSETINEYETYLINIDYLYVFDTP